jgi:hypothetical protein
MIAVLLHDRHEHEHQRADIACNSRCINIVHVTAPGFQG